KGLGCTSKVLRLIDTRKRNWSSPATGPKQAGANQRHVSNIGMLADANSWIVLRQSSPEFTGGQPFPAPVLVVIGAAMPVLVVTISATPVLVVIGAATPVVPDVPIAAATI